MATTITMGWRMNEGNASGKAVADNIKEAPRHHTCYTYNNYDYGKTAFRTKYS